jgi:hypothetical protein
MWPQLIQRFQFFIQSHFVDLDKIGKPLFNPGSPSTFQAGCHVTTVHSDLGIVTVIKALLAITHRAISEIA